MEAATSDNAAKTRRYYDQLWNQRDFSVIEDWIAPDFVGHHTARPEPVRGIDGFRAFADELLAAFPDLEMTVEDTIAQGDLVASRVTMRGTHAPTGVAVTSSFIGIERYRDGLCVEESVNSDDMGLARQLKRSG